MDSLISRQAAIDALDRFSLGETDAIKLAFRMGDYLKQLPSVQERKGRWIPWKKWNEDFVVCSECKLIGYKNYDALRPGYASNMNYCPNCGCAMTEGAEDETD